VIALQFTGDMNPSTPVSEPGRPDRSVRNSAAGGIVLCGGLSTRMGRPKAWLPFGPEFMLQRIVRVLSEVVSPIVVVAAVGQDLPELPATVEVLRDEHEALGPLAGLAVGLEALQGRVAATYVSSCDVPLLTAAFVARIVASLDGFDLAIPRDGNYHHPLAAVYATRLAATVRELIAANRLRPVFLLEHSRAREIDVAELRPVDPELQSLQNINTPAEYAAALRDAGFEADA
jgi:molybdopterin-guanine dinucleotide biosynthesis protein A